jgi:hypothetical protein
VSFPSKCIGERRRHDKQNTGRLVAKDIFCFSNFLPDKNVRGVCTASEHSYRIISFASISRCRRFFLNI